MSYACSRLWWLLGLLGTHLFIGIFVGLFFFSALMLGRNLAAYYVLGLPAAQPPRLKVRRSRVRGWPPPVVARFIQQEPNNDGRGPAPHPTRIAEYSLA